MQRTLVKSKIHKATVTAVAPEAEDAIVVDRDIMRRVGLWPYERVDVLNTENGARFSTSVLEGESGSGAIVVNGPGAFLAKPGHTLTILAYAILGETDLPRYQRGSVELDSRNRPVYNDGSK